MGDDLGFFRSFNSDIVFVKFKVEKELEFLYYFFKGYG